MAQLTPLYIVASARPRVGKTLIARLLMEYFHSADRPLVGYDLSPRDPALAGRFPDLVWSVDIADTRGQVALFDQLISRDSITRVVDVGYGAYDQFFNVMTEIGFAAEAKRRQIEPTVLFITESTASSVRAYAELRRRLPEATFIPVHNEAVSVACDKEDFPPSPSECRTIRIPRLSQIVRGVVDRPRFSFAAYLTVQPGGPTEIHDWIGTIFTEFRDLELRLMLGQLSSALGGAPPRAPGPRRRPGL